MRDSAKIERQIKTSYTKFIVIANLLYASIDTAPITIYAKPVSNSNTYKLCQFVAPVLVCEFHSL